MSNSIVKPEENALHIDLDAVLRSRLPRYYRFIPGFLIRRLEKIICQQEMNDMLDYCHGKRDADFCRGVLEHLDITLSIKGEGNLPDPAHRRVTIVSNHPLGGLDGMSLIKWAQEYWGGNVRFIVNDLLMAIEPLSGTFVPINKHGSQSRDASHSLDEAMEGNDPVLIFPAGLVSRRGDNGKVKDLKWQKMFVNKSIKNQRDIIPVHFNGHNSSFFYKFAHLRTKLGLKFNIEMIRLPREVFRSKGSHFTLSIGKLILWNSLKGGKDATETADAIKKIVYDLAPDESTN
ncbi:MAG: glycerol acyltransferase [Bacteroidales bacterium]|nr:glycerol acyltransferase [Bacteroidales bacterium]